LVDHLLEAAWGEKYVIGLPINLPVEGFARVDAVRPEELDQELYGSPFLGDVVAYGPVFLGNLVFTAVPLPVSHQSGHTGDLGVVAPSLEVEQAGLDRAVMSVSHEGDGHVPTHGVEVGLGQWLRFSSVEAAPVQDCRGDLGPSLPGNWQNANPGGRVFEGVQLLVELRMLLSVAVVESAEVFDLGYRWFPRQVFPGFPDLSGVSVDLFFCIIKMHIALTKFRFNFL